MKIFLIFYVYYFFNIVLFFELFLSNAIRFIHILIIVIDGDLMIYRKNN